MGKAKQETVLINETLFTRLSPLQKKILTELSHGPMTLKKLSKRAGKSVPSIGKQLSLLQMRTKYNPLHNKGLERPLVKKNKEAGVKTTYFLI